MAWFHYAKSSSLNGNFHGNHHYLARFRMEPS